MILSLVGRDMYKWMSTQDYHPLGYERVYLPLCKVADTPFHIHTGRYIGEYPRDVISEYRKQLFGVAVLNVATMKVDVFVD